MTVAQQIQIQKALASVGKDLTVIVAGKVHGNRNDQQLGKESRITIRTRFKVTSDSSSGNLVRTAKGNISGVAGYVPDLADKIIIDGTEFKFQLITPVELADGEVLLYKVEAVA